MWGKSGYSEWLRIGGRWGCDAGDYGGDIGAESGHLSLNNCMKYVGPLIESRQESSESGARGNHERWHVRRGVFNPKCDYCVAESGSIGGRSGGDSGPDRVLSHPTQPNPTIPNHTKTDSPHAHAREATGTQAGPPSPE